MSTSELLIQPLLVGATAWISAMYLDSPGDVAIGSIGKIPLPVFHAILAVGSGYVGQVVKQYVLTMGQSSADVSVESAFILPAFTALVDGTGMQILTGQGFMQGAEVGGLSQLVGTYAYQNIAQKYISQ